MAWIHEHRPAWRLAILVGWLVAMTGPWAYDRVHVPAAYSCSAPFVRLEGDSCGTPLSGLWILSWVAGGLIAMVVRPGMEDAALSGRVRELLFVFSALLPTAPLLTTLVVILGPGRRRWRVVHWVAWSLGLAVGSMLLFSSGLHLALWGSWLYVGLAAGALTLEMLALAAGRARRHE